MSRLKPPVNSCLFSAIISVKSIIRATKPPVDSCLFSPVVSVKSTYGAAKATGK